MPEGFRRRFLSSLRAKRSNLILCVKKRLLRHFIPRNDVGEGISFLAGCGRRGSLS